MFAIIDNNYVTAILLILLTVYAYKIRTGVPSYVKTLFRNNIFRVAILSLLLVHTFKSSPHVAIIIALFFVVTMHYIGEEDNRENFMYYSAIQRIR